MRNNINLSNWFYAFVRYRLHISAIFWFILFYGFKRLNENVDLLLVNAFFMWHFALYLFDRAFDADLDRIIHPNEAIPKKQKKSLILVSIFMSLLPFLLVKVYGVKFIYVYAILLPFTFLYTYPIFKNGIRAKNIFIIKNLYSAFVIWTFAPSFIFYNFSNIESSFFNFYLEIAFGAFIYVLIGEIFWDIRDIDGDKQTGVNTIPNTIGIFKTKLVLIILLFTDLFIHKNFSDYSFWVYLLLIIFIKSNWPNWVYHIPVLLSLFRFLFDIFNYEF